MDTEDRWAITETLSRVGHVFDDGRLDEIDTVFTADLVYDMSAVGMPVINGIEAARELAEQLGAHGPIAHYVSNVVIVSEDGDEVAVDSKGLMLMADRTLNGVVHHDVLRRDPAGWRIARRVIVPQGTAVPA
ncbi:nuclear transport factor 2 family protein [Auraticoccus monumenti]|uniref:SnoaL-like domain-containing protein n=1 Tax=Auraticoccus monumenti TaxID=675864 RepID=A0A1G6V1A5_9ACTN|nr:nuclear transport factor 2 family protein [Auraticoccus monumenti]SDD46736.1 SnoaL-like domain-containing protein [Auraticoccus monumenti]